MAYFMMFYGFLHASNLVSSLHKHNNLLYRMHACAYMYPHTQSALQLL